ncbi:glycine cleavage system protein R [Rhodovastum atsumiense]|uniref:ACT domain-containing protein n=1 Tax=Rhodovastum atsumiense TaxID=504468 RepID=A0A5M6IJ17_9PROT|nr:ACT domain-containing protein [Rhodovastum atsumiense]KAA5608254.1 ACT domain-containing protein [Rhodovastum atsumiense]
MASLILTLVGPDRPGVVRQLSEEVAARGGNWLESRMARLAGQFAGIALVAVPRAELAGFSEAVAAYQSGGLRVLVQEGSAQTVSIAHTAFQVELIGQDRPGIVRDITQALANRGVNIEELTTDVLSGSFSGEHLFRAEIRLRAPAAEAVDLVREDLERLGNELMVDIRTSEPDDGTE